MLAAAVYSSHRQTITTMGNDQKRLHRIHLCFIWEMIVGIAAIPISGDDGHPVIPNPGVTRIHLFCPLGLTIKIVLGGGSSPEVQGPPGVRKGPSSLINS